MTGTAVAGTTRTSEASSGAAGNREPRIWLLLGDKVGDNRQVERIADALGMTTQTRRLRFAARWREGKPLFVPSLFHVDRAQSDVLEAPWPDLILTVGRRPAMAALWVRRRSGNRTRIVLVGRPKRFFDDFALVISPAQYRLPDHPRVLTLGLPLIRLDPEAVAAEAHAWRERLASLPRPLTVLLVGGRTKPFRMDAQVARDMIARTLAELPAGGGLYVSTSRRTPPAVVDALRAALPAHARLHGFEANGGDNPYLALLGLGDRFVVTGDSVSMLTEIARLGKPLAIYPLPEEPGIALRMRRAIEAVPWLRSLADGLRRAGLASWPRDLTALHDLLVDAGWARRLGDAEVGGEEGATEGGSDRHRLPEDELQRVADRVRAIAMESIGEP